MARSAPWTGATRIDSPADVARVLAGQANSGLTRAGVGALAVAVRPATETSTSTGDAARILPVAEPLAGLLPWAGGLRRGATVQVVGSLTLVALLMAKATATGAYASVVGVPGLGGRAFHELGVRLERLLLVPEPGDQWAEATAAMADGTEIVAVRPPGRPPAGQMRALTAKVRARGCVLLVLRDDWDAADAQIRATARRFYGLRDGRGCISASEIDAEVRGRGAAGRPQRATLRMESVLFGPDAGQLRVGLASLAAPEDGRRLRAVPDSAPVARPSAP